MEPQRNTINPQMTEAAFRVGLKLLTSETISTPNAWNKDLGILQDVMAAVLTGQLVLAPATPPSRSEGPPEA